MQYLQYSYDERKLGRSLKHGLQTQRHYIALIWGVEKLRGGSHGWAKPQRQVGFHHGSREKRQDSCKGCLETKPSFDPTLELGLTYRKAPPNSVCAVEPTVEPIVWQEDGKAASWLTKLCSSFKLLRWSYTHSGTACRKEPLALRHPRLPAAEVKQQRFLLACVIIKKIIKKWQNGEKSAFGDVVWLLFSCLQWSARQVSFVFVYREHMLITEATAYLSRCRSTASAGLLTFSNRANVQQELLSIATPLVSNWLKFAAGNQ